MDSTRIPPAIIRCRRGSCADAVAWVAADVPEDLHVAALAEPHPQSVMGRPRIPGKGSSGAIIFSSLARETRRPSSSEPRPLERRCRPPPEQSECSLSLREREEARRAGDRAVHDQHTSLEEVPPPLAAIMVSSQ